MHRAQWERVGGEDSLDEPLHAGVIAAFERGDHRHFPSGNENDLAIENVALHGISSSRNLLALGDKYPGIAAVKVRETMAEIVEKIGLVGPGVGVAQKYVGVGDSDDIVVENAGVDGAGILADEKCTNGGDLVQASESLDRWKRLTGGEYLRR